jgi:K+-transporting ATPase ATPase A chain
MNQRDLLQLAVFLAGLLVLTPVLGGFMARLFSGERTVLTPVVGPLERLTYRLSGIDAEREQTWREYLGALVLFNALGIVVLLLLQTLQAWLPGNPAALANVPFALALNTAISFVTNTNWQAYSGETTMSYGTQMAGLAVQNFLSAATGIAAAIALIRGLTRRSTRGLGNFWADMVRATLYVLLPLSLIIAVVLVSQGVVQTFAPYRAVTTLEGATQVIPLGPAASQIAIKQLGTNGGGFFGVNAAHPFENPTPLSNFVQVFAIFLIPAALTFTFGTMTGDRRQGWTIFTLMLTLFLSGLAVLWWAELQPNPAISLAVSMEGKETRFGIFNSALFATVTTDASCGAVNAMHDSLSPMGGLVPLVNMMLGEVIFGGVGAGLYGILMFVILTVFIAGLMVGRSPEYLGKKIEAPEIRWAVVAVLAPCAIILLGTAATLLYPAALATLNNAGPHGLSEVLYAYTSAAANNGSAFAGIGVNTDWYNYTLAAAMLIGRFAIIIPALAIAGSLAAKKVSPPSVGTFPTHGATFGLLLVAVILIVGALTFLPALSLGPIVEHFLMLEGRTF